MLSCEHRAHNAYRLSAEDAIARLGLARHAAELARHDAERRAREEQERLDLESEWVWPTDNGW